MTTARSILMTILLVSLCAAVSPSALAQATCEELEKQLAELTKRIEALENQRKAAAARPETPKPTTQVSAAAGREEALVLYKKVDGLMATGNLLQARREMEAYNEKYAGTQAAGWTRSLARELEVVGKPAPDDWKIEKWYQGESDVALDGNRPTLLIFWESWCPHCRNEVPKLQKVYDDYKDKGLQVLGVTRLTRTSTEESVLEFIEESAVSYPMAKETGELATYFNVKGIPAAAVVNNGQIVWRGHPMRLTEELLGIWF